jgi:hypothetical protein
MCEPKPALLVAPKARFDRFPVLPPIQNGEDFDGCAREFIEDAKREPLRESSEQSVLPLMHPRMNLRGLDDCSEACDEVITRAVRCAS